jgi:hypothetical protein
VSEGVSANDDRYQTRNLGDGSGEQRLNSGKTWCRGEEEGLSEGGETECSIESDSAGGRIDGGIGSLCTTADKQSGWRKPKPVPSEASNSLSEVRYSENE